MRETQVTAAIRATTAFLGAALESSAEAVAYSPSPPYFLLVVMLEAH
jgi:hypothetical protein